MGKIKILSQFPRRSISKSPPPPPQAEQASGSTAPTAEELLKFDVNRDGRILWPGRAAMFEIPGHPATDDELSCVIADGDTFISLQEEEEEEEELPLGDGKEEAHGIGAGGGITVHSGAVTTAAVERRVTISDDSRQVVIIIDAGVERLETTTGAAAGVMGVSAGEDINEEEDRTKTLLWMVGILGGLSDSAAGGAAMYRSPRGVAAHGGDVAYRVGLASVFTASVVQMLVACLVCRRTQTRQARAILKKILYVAIFTLVLSIALDGAALVLNML